MTLEILTSDILSPTPHGFFTRKGGASSGIFEGLNCGLGSSDQSDIVTINRARVAGAMDVTPGALKTVHQIHSANIVRASDAPTGSEKADGMVTDQPGLALGILTADCQPVLFFDPKAQVIGATHAGWKGALNGALEATIEAMEDLGANRDTIQAAIGPSISQRAYEVGPEFLDTFLAEDESTNRYFANGKDDRYQFDLVGYSLNRLRKAGVHDVEWIGHCTYSDPDRFYSYRRSVHHKEADYGRLISVIRL